MTSIRLTGRILDWDGQDCEEVSIAPEEVAEHEASGFIVIEFQGMLLASRAIEPEDGDIQIQPKSDMAGRAAAGGGHANAGYSGYYKGYVWLGGKRRMLVDWWALFPQREHGFAAQQDRPKAEEAIRSIVHAKAGAVVAKVAGGFALDPAAHIQRKVKAV